jgi:hypothetical protein
MSGNLQELGAKLCSPVLELKPHGIKFSQPVTMQITVPVGDEDKQMVLLHRYEPHARSATNNISTVQM